MAEHGPLEKMHVFLLFCILANHVFTQSAIINRQMTTASHTKALQISKYSSVRLTFISDYNLKFIMHLQ